MASADLLNRVRYAEYGILIDGRFGEAASAERFATVNPANNDTLMEIPKGGRADIDKAVKAAKEAFEGGPWSSLSPGDRGRLLHRVGGLIRERAERLAVVETLDNGKPLSEAREDVLLAADCFEFYAGLANKIFGETIPVPGEFLNFTLREPIGVVGQIVPWNYPILMAAWKIAPALAAGNTVVFKPASYTPLTALEIGLICLEAGIPQGVVNVVPGPGDEIGLALVSHPDVGKVAFTGETTTGRLIMQAAAADIKKVSLELGGKSPNVVFDDADVRQAVNGSLFAIYPSQGQNCCAGSRLLLHESIYDEFLERFVAKAAAIKVGDGLAEGTQMGPLISRSHLARVKEYIRLGLEEGATLLTGGKEPDDPALSQGNYLLPTVFGGVDNRMRIAQEEIFGPVVVAIKFTDDEEAIKLANESRYGLAAGVWSRDIKRALNAARRLRAGYVWVNTYNLIFSETPFGGYKQSGLGRELGTHAIELYTEIKNVQIDLSRDGLDWYGSDQS